MDPDQKSTRGFASLSPQRRSEVAKLGGQASSGNFKNDPNRASEAGRRGGERSKGGGRSPNH